mmetsp:Transcript_74691/g.230869  ORF Transcript_74691/g.230869 Transcript_74691/m.230869 type:complete len:201 (-) Transcript_74691:524-1126(-)
MQLRVHHVVGGQLNAAGVTSEDWRYMTEQVGRGVDGVLHLETVRGHVHGDLLAVLDAAEPGHRRHDDGAFVAAGDEAVAHSGGDVDGAVGTRGDVQVLDPRVWRPLEPRRLVQAAHVHGAGCARHGLGRLALLGHGVDLIVPDEALVHGLPQLLEGHGSLGVELRDGLRDPRHGLRQGHAGAHDHPEHVEVLRSDGGRLC